ncbi:hypothetical protein EYF80_061118 [Liparis tanakae]|uniref:Uncharacterized protein n=1 Tax=Liparis tanakae TaxID=230148 RepID=A0A4Z2EJX0_9TELE|nr:hypothetical protein EYF80_061118 [Liparis tanakae]
MFTSYITRLRPNRSRRAAAMQKKKYNRPDDANYPAMAMAIVTRGGRRAGSRWRSLPGLKRNLRSCRKVRLCVSAKTPGCPSTQTKSGPPPPRLGKLCSRRRVGTEIIPRLSAAPRDAVSTVLLGLIAACRAVFFLSLTFWGKGFSGVV